MDAPLFLVGPAELAKPWRTLWKPFLAKSIPRSSPTVEVRREEWGYSVHSPGREVNVTDGWRALVESRNDAVRVGLEGTRGVIDVHAAVLVRNQAALLLLGEAWAGKTTIALALVDRGWRYFSDDVAVIERGTGLVRPLPKPPGVKAHSWEDMRSHWSSAAPVELGRPPGPFVIPPPFVGSLEDRARPTWTVILSYKEEAKAAVTSLTSGQALARLGEFAGAVDAGTLSALAAVVSSTRPVLLAYGSTPDAVARIEEIVR